MGQVKKGLLKNVTGKVGGVVLTLDGEQRTIVREMPVRGNQGKAEAHVPQQSRIRSLGKMTKRLKAVFRQTITTFRKASNASSQFIKLNGTTAGGQVLSDGTVNYPLLIVADGAADSAGLSVSPGNDVNGDESQIDTTISWVSNADGENIELRWIIISQENLSGIVMNSGETQDGVGGVHTIDTSAYPSPAVYAFWLDADTGETSPSVFIYG